MTTAATVTLAEVFRRSARIFANRRGDLALRPTTPDQVVQATSVPLRKFVGILRLRTPMRASGGPARRRHASKMRSS